MKDFSSTTVDSTILATSVANALIQTRRLAFAHIAPDLTVVLCSANFHTIVEHTEQKIIGSLITDLLWEYVGAEDELKKVLHGTTPNYDLQYINRFQPDNDTVIYLDFHITLLDANQPQRGLLLIVEDVTREGRSHQHLQQDRNELILLQQELAVANKTLARINRLKSLFLSMAAHDLRTPLSIIIGYAELIDSTLATADYEESKKLLPIILMQAQRLDRLINSILDLDAIEREELVLEPADHDLNKVVEEVVHFLPYALEKRNITLNVSLSAHPIHLFIDHEKICRVLYNLIGNAYKYTQSGGTISVTVAQSKQMAIVEVKDNGRGIHESQLANLFQLYYRTEEAKRSEMKGTGLGLYIVKMLVDAHQGQITVSSQRGVGSVFTIYLPISVTADG